MGSTAVRPMDELPGAVNENAAALVNAVPSVSDWDMRDEEPLPCALDREAEEKLLQVAHCNTLCNTLQHTATHCNTLCNTLQHTATHYNTLQHTATHCNALQHTATILMQVPCASCMYTIMYTIMYTMCVLPA